MVELLLAMVLVYGTVSVLAILKSNRAYEAAIENGQLHYELANRVKRLENEHRPGKGINTLRANSLG